MDEQSKNSTIEKKYKKFIKFCEDNGRMPKYNAKSMKERKIRLFYVNKKNIMTRGDKGLSDPLPEWEKKYIKKMESFRETISDKLNLVLEYCKKYNRVPSYTYKDVYTEEEEIERNIYKKYNAVKNFLKKDTLSKKDNETLNEILKFRNKRQLPRIEKMQLILDYCIEHNVTPKLHVEDKKEKKLAEFLSTIKTLKKDNKLDKKEQNLLKTILKYSTHRDKIRNDNFKKLKSFIETKKSLPINKIGKSPEERKLAIFYIKLKWKSKKGNLSITETKILKRLHKICGLNSINNTTP